MHPEAPDLPFTVGAVQDLRTGQGGAGLADFVKEKKFRNKQKRRRRSMDSMTKQSGPPSVDRLRQNERDLDSDRDEDGSRDWEWDAKEGANGDANGDGNGDGNAGDGNGNAGRGGRERERGGREGRGRDAGNRNAGNGNAGDAKGAGTGTSRLGHQQQQGRVHVWRENGI
ncbi:hypothetical protein C8R44DRAFT_739409 [Mycena epipterygia]|nr:hypothetical protein C8R44DRAFT_739409 [Mycena epipterygia]